MEEGKRNERDGGSYRHQSVIKSDDTPFSHFPYYRAKVANPYRMQAFIRGEEGGKLREVITARENMGNNLCRTGKENAHVAVEIYMREGGLRS
jgi:hypothetical protein